MTKPVRFIHLSDSHIGPNRAFSMFNVSPAENLKRVVDVVNSIPDTIDFVIHTGDAVSDPDAQAYTLLAELLKELNCPIFFVSGNHDDSAALRESFSFSRCKFLCPDSSSLCYRFRVANEDFLVLDALSDPQCPSQASLPIEQLELTKQVLSDCTGTLSIFLHYPPRSVESAWIEKSMMLTNGSLLHEVLSPYAKKIRGVFYGHVHRNLSSVEDGILYRCSVGTTFVPELWPSTETPAMETATLPGFSLVSLLENSTIVKDFSVPI